VPGIGAEFFVGAGVVMADHTVHVALGPVKSKGLVFPAVAGMATGAPWFIGQWRAAKVVGGDFLANGLAGGWVDGFPGPVNALHHLVTRGVVAGQAGFGDFRARLERAFQASSWL
jgi:hypothetical protein